MLHSTPAHRRQHTNNSAPTTEEAHLAAEQAYLKPWATPLAVKAIFHILLLLPILMLSVKLSQYTEAVIYFDGVSLGLILLVLGLWLLGE
ncbi:hypothetical protein PCANC_04897 [Puccinia coronata f. sp. avenae]|uniref:Uncharacterized protein n=1 Tax=Puccinia coronata f. sp. avenae TaxID=200324 RepID=A0A2N5VWI3_9BASI|nr:hypothetical protein PCANC_18107 [Puccinia coronata f. sp. avenae]PLW16776.1 hypothetical protein PCASD_17163 [Puccinia coronata f. sp. avenae]PLW48618.1 hypothetical protein PCASD_03381 [Puccinia coronata f. sp. avenae]PLW54357.1 hypothetical protein PCANC_04897 [Puccinia coronata f. sp. avenae]